MNAFCKPGRCALLCLTVILLILPCDLRAETRKKPRVKMTRREKAIFNEGIELPRFCDNGIECFRQWVLTNVKYPKAVRIEGTVVVSFVIDTDGSLTDITVLQSPAGQLSIEVIRALQTSPKWTPGMKEGLPVKISYVLPVIFQLPEQPPPVFDPSDRL